MAIVTGKIVFDPERTLLDGEQGIPGVTVLLRQEETGLGLTARSDREGFFRFIGLPAGRYRLTAAWGLEAYSPIGDFSMAQPWPHPPDGRDPPLTQVGDSLPKSGGRLASLTPNTRFFTLREGDSPTYLFFDGPQGEHPLELPPLLPEELLPGGDLGSLPAGTHPAYRPSREPWPDQTPGYVYTPCAPSAGEYTVTNLTSGGFGRHTLADHTTGTEQGQMLLAAPAKQSGSAFTRKVLLEPGRRYAFTLWAATNERFDTAQPREVEVSAQGEDGLLWRKICPLTGGYLPQWQQLGGVFTCGPGREVLLRAIPRSPGGLLYLDDFSLRALDETPPALCLKARGDRLIAPIGSSIRFTLCMKNLGGNSTGPIALTAHSPDALGLLAPVTLAGGAPLTWQFTPQGALLSLPPLPPGEEHHLTFEGVLEALADRNPITLSLEASLAQQPVARALVDLWVSDRCFCQCLCGQPALGFLPQGDLSHLLGLSQEEVQRLLADLKGEVPALEKVLRQLGLLFPPLDSTGETTYTKGEN